MPAAQRLREEGGQTSADEPAKTGACTDESEQPLRLPGIENEVRESPELSDEEDRVDLAEPVQCRRDPSLEGACLDRPRIGRRRWIRVERPEEHQQSHHDRLRDRDDPAPGHEPAQLAVKLHQEPNQENRDDHHVGQVLCPVRRDELRSRNWLDHVVSRHGQEGIGEHQEDSATLLLPDFDEASEDALQDVTLPSPSLQVQGLPQPLPHMTIRKTGVERQRKALDQRTAARAVHWYAWRSDWVVVLDPSRRWRAEETGRRRGLGDRKPPTALAYLLI